MLFVGQHLIARAPRVPAFSTPVTETYARQVRLVTEALKGSKSIALSPAMNSDLARVKGADVFLIFIESYGAVTYDRPQLAQRLAPTRAQFEAAIHATNRDV